MRSASLYSRDNSIYIHAVSYTESCLGIAWEPVIRLDDPSEAQIEAAVLEALEGSVSGVADDSNQFGRILKLAKKSSVKSFSEGAKCVEIEETDSGLRLIPTRNGGPREGFIHLNESAIECPSDGQLGSLIIEALARSS